MREGIKWENIEYFNNKLICDMIEKRPIGIFPLLDETCILANGTDLTFLDKLNKNFGKNDRYASWETTKKKDFSRESFLIKHYAGDVYYKVNEFVSKNQDTLYRDQVFVTRYLIIINLYHPLKFYLNLLLFLLLFFFFFYFYTFIFIFIF